MSQDEIPAEVLAEFILSNSEAVTVRLLDRYPGLDEYLVPAMALMVVIRGLWRNEPLDPDAPEGPEVEVYSTIDGETVARTAAGAEQTYELYIPQIVAIARYHLACLNERGYRLLNEFANHHPNPLKKKQMQRIKPAFRYCLDQGVDDRYILKQEINAANVADWIRSGGRGEIGFMPPMPVNERQMSALLEYLKTLQK